MNNEMVCSCDKLADVVSFGNGAGAQIPYNPANNKQFSYPQRVSERVDLGQSIRVKAPAVL